MALGKSLNKNVVWYENLIFFRVFYVLTLMLEMVSVVNFFAAVGRCFALAWGMFIFVRNCVYPGKIFKVPHFRLVFSYIFCSILTTILNCTTNFLPNLVIVYHSIICFFLFFGMLAVDESENIKQEMIFLAKCFYAFATFSSIFSFFIIIFKIQFSLNFLGEPRFFGIFQNRLTGFYTNSNLLAFMMVVSVISSDILRVECFKNDGFKICLLNCGNTLNILSLFLSDSNASLVFMAIYFIVKFFCNNYLQLDTTEDRRKFTLVIMTILYSIVIIFLAVFLKRICQNGANSFVELVNKFETPENPSIETSVIGRKNYDIDSGRFTLWTQGFEIWKHRPIFGIGRENLVSYGEKYLTDGIIFSDLHNGYLTILVSNGIVGFVIFAIFAFSVASDMFEKLFNLNKIKSKNGNNVIKNAKIYSIFFSAICGYGVYSFFERTIFSGLTFMVIYFWLILGYAYCYLQDTN